MTDTGRRSWTRSETLAAFKFYLRTPFGRFHQRNPELIVLAKQLKRTPSAVAMKLCNLASLDSSVPAAGLANASSLDKTLWREMECDWESFFEEMQQVSEVLRSALSETEPTSSGVNYEGRESARLNQVRIGQTMFRQAVLTAYEERCCISGLDIPTLLVASHIVPWAEDKSNRLNPRNGLCLSNLHDRAFDKGIISISEDWRVIVSSKYRLLKQEFFQAAIVAYEGSRIALPKRFMPSQAFLSVHRTSIFQN